MMRSIFLVCLLVGSSLGKVSWKPTEKGIDLLITKDDDESNVLLSGNLGNHINFIDGSDESKDVNLVTQGNTVYITWTSTNTSRHYRDCFDLRKNDTNWFGGPERREQVWPIENMKINSTDHAWVLGRGDNFAVIEPYWLNSKGVYLYVDPISALSVDQNNLEQDKVCFMASVDGVYVGRKQAVLNYTIGVFENPKEAHLHAINNYLGKPTAHPDERMIREPIWTTWAKYKADINDELVTEFAQNISDHGYSGQLEIDDNWEPCYGAQEFRQDKFANINDTVKTLHDLDFRVTLWVHPFVNKGCQPNEDEGLEKGYFAKNTNGDTNANWWNGDGHQIDFTNSEAQQWYLNRLNKLKSLHGIDSFKFDAGETDYVNQPAVYPNADINLAPNVLTGNYVRTCAEMGTLIEVRSAWKSQDLPIFVRMLDKDSTWDIINGLKSLVTTLLQMNMNGYVMVLPDMIGGNGYNGAPDAELLVRWAQANIFMPSMQFSYLPWDITSDEFDAAAIVKKTVDLHLEYSDQIIAAMNESIANGTPVNPPIWWIDPDNRDAHKVNDEYLLGENILVAPVVEQGATTRNVYLPTGSWKDGNSGKIYQGPTLVESYNAPIDILPYFIKQ